jgi:glycolate oxidase FAD binding subunit
MTEPQLAAEGARAAIAAIVGAEHIRPALPADSLDGLQPVAVVAPADAAQVAAVLHCCADRGLAVAPRGGGSKLALGNCPARLDFVLSTERLNRVVEHAAADLTVTVEAGYTIARLQAALAAGGQRLACDPLLPERATVGGVVATAESGTLRIRYGAIRDLVLGLDLALPDGNLVRAGGKVVKNVAGYDLTRLAIGSLGTLGVITRVTFRLHPVAVARASWSAVLPSAEAAGQLLLAIRQSHVVFTGLQVRATRPGYLTVDVCCEGIPESLSEYRVRLAQATGGAAFADSAPEVWEARSALYAESGDALVLKASVQPGQVGDLCAIVFRCVGTAGAAASVVAQASGLAEVRIEGSDAAQRALLSPLEAEIEKLGGSLVVARAPLALKRELDVWGRAGASLEVMRRIKQKFDPAGVLNPGRFLGGI